MVRSARIHHLVKSAGIFGTRTGEVTLDWDAVVRRQHEVVRQLQPSPEAFEKLGAKVHLAEARFVDLHTLEVNGRRVQGEKIIIAAGSEPVAPPLPGRELAITSDQILFLPRFPESLTLVGAGVIGLEMAGAFADLGSRVTVIGKDPEILPTLDADVAAYIRKILEAKGVTFHLASTVERFSGRPGAIATHIRREGASLTIESGQVCLAVGRRFNPTRLGTDRLGLELGELGLKVSPYLRSFVVARINSLRWIQGEPPRRRAQNMRDRAARLNVEKIKPPGLSRCRAAKRRSLATFRRKNAVSETLPLVYDQK